MHHRKRQYLIFPWLILAMVVVLHGRSQTQRDGTLPSGSVSEAVPKTWDEKALAGLYVPLAEATRTPIPVSSEYYYRIPVRKIYKSYPIYAPGKEPPGYREWLKKQEPEELKFDFANCKTPEDWGRIGAIIFEAPLRLAKDWNKADLSDPAVWQQIGLPVAAEGTIPYARYAIRKKGEIEIADGGCILCHSRVLPDGSVLKGAQGDLPAGRFVATVMRKQAAATEDARGLLQAMRTWLERYEAMPWKKPDPAQRAATVSVEDIAVAYEALPSGVIDRLHMSLYFSTTIPDLIGVKDRQYLNHTGHVQHRGMGDLMRYAALVQGMNEFDRYGDFRYSTTLPEPETLGRYSDEQLYALAQYIYSLKPPPNPNKFDDLAKQGQQVFNREGCASCHTPPLYTNNKLIPVTGFTPPAEHYRKYSIMPFSIDLDSRSTLQSRLGTGYYKVPSLKGVWYRGPFEHNGSVATLEDWFDPQRLEPMYVPTGFRGVEVKQRAVPGHQFGLALSAEDKKTLIAFLKTL